MPGREERETSEKTGRPLEGLPVIRRGVAGNDFGGENRFGERAALGVCCKAGQKWSRSSSLWGHDRRADTHGGVAESTAGRVGGQGKHRGVLDCPARGAGSARFASAAGGYPAAGASAGAGQKIGPERL